MRRGPAHVAGGGVRPRSRGATARRRLAYAALALGGVALGAAVVPTHGDEVRPTAVHRVELRAQYGLAGSLTDLRRIETWRFGDRERVRDTVLATGESLETIRAGGRITMWNGAPRPAVVRDRPGAIADDVDRRAARLRAAVELGWMRRDGEIEVAGRRALVLRARDASPVERGWSVAVDPRSFAPVAGERRAGGRLVERRRLLLQAIHRTGRPYVVVLMNGRPLELDWLDQHAPAILEAWYPGTQAGHAVADVLLGKVNPGGKLPVTFPRTVGQIPLAYNHKNTGRPPDPSNKYTSKYLDAPVTPLYPFGHGLSYTTFAISNVRLSAEAIPADGAITVTADVQNTGRRTGDEVVQLYIRDRVASVTRPVRELRGFERVTLQPGERRQVSFTLPSDDLAFWNQELKRVVEPSEFDVWVGDSSAVADNPPDPNDPQHATFRVTG